MLGDILEKPVAKVASLVVSTSTGFPLSRKITRRSPLSEHAGTPVPPQPLPQIISSAEPRNAGGKRGDCTEEDENDILIRSMSEKERSDALEEIKSLISVKNIAFLQSMPKQNINEADAPVPVRKERGSTSNLSTKSQSSPPLTAERTTPVPVPSGPVDIFSTIPKFGSSNPAEPLVLGQNQALLKERFDLDGRRIVDLTSAPGVLKEDLDSSGLLSAAQVEAICAICISAGHTVCSGIGGFALSLDQARDAAAHQPQDELRHHQYDGEAPGYNFTEMSEMFRSQYSSQRVVAMRMLCGALLRRDCVVALEAYAAAFDALDLTGPTEAIGVLGPVYESAVAEVRKVLSGADEVHEAQARRLVVNAFLRLLCCSDLPVDLPTLLLWALGTGAMKPASGFGAQDQDEDAIAPSFGGSGASLHNPLAAKLALLRCVSLYLRSPAEELAATLLRDNSILWPSNGCPRLATPHARRPHVPYEQHMSECAVRATQLLNEADDEGDDAEEGAQGKTAAPESILEAFALQCRWSRMDAMCSRSGLVGQLFGHALAAVDTLTGAEARSAQVPAATEALVVLGKEALALLVYMVRQGGGETVRQASRQLARAQCWQLLVSYLRAGGGYDATDLTGRLGLEVRCLCWRLLNEVAMRDRSAVVRLWGSAESLPSIALKVVLQVLSSVGAEVGTQRKEAALALAFLRTSLCYGLGVSAVTELLLALKLQGCGTLRLSDSLAADVLILLEQAAVTCAQAVHGEIMRPRQDIGGPPQQKEEVLQAASALLSFARQHLQIFEEALVGAAVADRRTSGALLGFLCAVLGGAVQRGPPSETGLSLEAYSARRLASEVLAATQLRGPGLCGVLAGAGAELFAAQPRGAVAGQPVSIDSAAAHVHGQCADLLWQCATMRLFSPSAVHLMISALTSVSGTDGNIAAVVRAEQTIFLQRFTGIVAGVSGLTGDEGMAGVAVSARTVGAGCVSAGLIQWHLERLSQASVLEQLSFYCGMAFRSSDSTFLTKLVLKLGELGNGVCWSPFFAPVLDTVVRSYVRHLLVVSGAVADSTDGGVGAVVAHTVAQRCTLLEQEHADLAALVCDITLASFAGLYCGADILTEISLCDWALREHDKEAPAALLPSLRQNWAFEVLGNASMRGPAFRKWLSVLYTVFGAPGPSSGGAIRASMLAERVFSLLKVSTADQVAKWLDPSSSDEDSVDGAAVDTFRALLFALVRVAAKAGSDEFCRAFCEVTAKEHSEGAGMVTALRRRAAARAKTAGRASLSRRVDLDGALDVCEKVVDAATNQAVDSGVHGAALLVMVSPVMPWAVRQRVWAQLGELGLVHLLEDADGLQQLLPVLLASETGGTGLRESAALYCDMATALVGLRAPSDRQFRIVAVSVQQIAQFIFSPSRVNGMDDIGYGSGVISGAAAHVLTHLQQLLCDDGDRARWLVQSVLDTAAALKDGQGQQLNVLREVTDELAVTVPPVLRGVPIALPASSSGQGQVSKLATLFL